MKRHPDNNICYKVHYFKEFSEGDFANALEILNLCECNASFVTQYIFKEWYLQHIPTTFSHQDWNIVWLEDTSDLITSSAR